MKFTEVITEAIKELGIPASVKGYHYIRYAIELLINDITLVSCVSKVVYPTVAKEFNTTYTGAERAIRHGIETGWNRANPDFVNKLFGYSVDANRGRPTNSEFIATVADYIIMTFAQPTEKGGVEK